MKWKKEKDTQVFIRYRKKNYTINAIKMYKSGWKVYLFRDNYTVISKTAKTKVSAEKIIKGIMEKY